MLLGQHRHRARAGQQARDRRTGVARRPSAVPISAAITHQPSRRPAPCAFARRRCRGEHADGAQRGGGAGAEQHGGFEEVDETHLDLQQRLEQAAHAIRAIDRKVGLRGQLGRRLVGADRHRRRRSPARPRSTAARAARGRRRGRWCRRRRTRAASTAAPSSSAVTPSPLSSATGADLEHLAPPVHDEALALGLRGDLRDRGCGGILVGGATPMEGGDRLLVLAAHAQSLALARHRPLRTRARAPSTPPAQGRPPGASPPGAAARRRGCRRRRSSRWPRSGGRSRPGGRSRSRPAGSAWRSRSATSAWPPGHARRQRGARSAPACRLCRTERPSGRDQRGPARAPPRALRRGTRGLVWRAWPPGPACCVRLRRRTARATLAEARGDRHGGGSSAASSGSAAAP